MADIFISYSTHDARTVVERLVPVLQKQGWQVWWDTSNLLSGDEFRSTIEKELAAARCVLVLWSRAAKQSGFVLDEAERGRRRGVLVQAIVDDLEEAPLGFGSLHWINLGSGATGFSSQSLRTLLESVRRKVSVAPATAPTLRPIVSAAAPAPAPPPIPANLTGTVSRPTPTDSIPGDARFSKSSASIPPAVITVPPPPHPPAHRTSFFGNALARPRLLVATLFVLITLIGLAASLTTGGGAPASAYKILDEVPAKKPSKVASPAMSVAGSQPPPAKAAQGEVPAAAPTVPPEKLCEDGQLAGCQAWLVAARVSRDASAVESALTKACNLDAADSCRELGALCRDRRTRNYDKLAVAAYRRACEDLHSTAACGDLKRFFPPLSQDEVDQFVLRYEDGLKTCKGASTGIATADVIFDGDGELKNVTPHGELAGDASVKDCVAKVLSLGQLRVTGKIRKFRVRLWYE